MRALTKLLKALLKIPECLNCNDAGCHWCGQPMTQTEATSQRPAEPTNSPQGERGG